MASQSSTLERAPVIEHPIASGVKTILFHVQNDSSLDRRLETALSLTRACDAHLSCLHVTPIEAYVAFDSFGGVFVMNDVIKTLDDEELKLRVKVEEKLQSEGAAWDYVQVTGNVPTQIIRHAALSDLIIVGRQPYPADFAGPTTGFLGDLLYRSRIPLLVPGNKGGPIDPTGTVVIAWDASHEAANAVRASVGLLKLASEVRVVQVREAEKSEAFPGKRLLGYLSRHGIHAELHLEQSSGARGEAIAGVLMAHASAADAAYMVMGGYNHSRVGEFLFGGVTRTLLEDCAVPLFIAH